MSGRLLLILTMTSLFGLLPSIGSTAPLCSWVFQSALEDAPPIQESISSHLQNLRASLLELRQDLKSNKGTNNRLKTLDDLQESPREIAYVLQGAYRLILAHPEADNFLSTKEKKAFAKGLRDMKWLEKTLGTYEVHADLLRTAKKIKVAGDFLEFLTQKRNEASHRAIEQLREHDFLDKEISTVMKHVEKLKDLKHLKKLGHKDLILESFEAEANRVYQKVETEIKPLIMKERYGYIELEEGAHAFRRSLRWLRVYLQAYEAYFYSNEASPFQSKPSNNKLALNAEEYNHLVSSIDLLRKIKKPGEMREKMRAALVSFGFWNGTPINSANAADFIYPLMSEKFDNLELKTQEILKIYEAHDGFRHILQVAP